MSKNPDGQISLFDDAPSVQKEYDELVTKLNFYCDQYYDENASDISDADYDALNRRLKRIEAEHPELVDKEKSPSFRVGWKATKGVLVKHNVPMLSLQDVFSRQEVYDFVEQVHKDMGADVDFLVETKIDGLSMALRYEQGKLTRAITRGDGITEGEDVTKNAKMIDDVVKTMVNPIDYIEIRGEVYMTRDAFSEVNSICEEAGKKPFANPRNCAAGTLRQIDTRITKERKLSLFIFNVQETKGVQFKSHLEGYEYLKANGVKVIETYYHCTSADEVWDAIERIGQARGELAYDIDGAVVKINNLEVRKQLGNTIKYPRWAIAYKYPPEEKETVLRSIEVGTGRTGRVTPVAVFDPIRLCGTSVSRATLHNQDFIDELGIGIGDTLLVYKSGEIIPKVKAVIKSKRPTDWKPYRMPTTCPICGKELVRLEGAADLKCINLSCPGTLEGRIVNFVSRDCMNIKGFGREYIRALIDKKLVSGPADIFELRQHYDELIEGHVFGLAKNTDKLLNAIDEAVKLGKADKVLASIGIPNVGKATAKELINHFKSIDAIMLASQEQLSEVGDIGAISAQAIYEFMHDEESLKLVNRLKTAGLCFSKTEDALLGTSLEGKTFVITGTFQGMTRDEASALIESYGGKIASSVSKNTSYLLAGEKAGSKLTKATDLGIPVIDEDALQVLINN